MRSQKDILTRREREVLAAVASGLCTKEISTLLGIALKTVGRHRQQINDKLNIRDRVLLTHYAISTHLIRAQRFTQAERFMRPL